MSYLLHLAIYFCVYAILGIGLNFVLGYCGLLTLAHAAFFAVGCYCYALGTQVFHWNILESLATAVVLAALLSLLVSLPSWRLTGDFFVMTSLAVLVLLMSGLNNWSEVGPPIGSWANFTNGPSGIAGIPRPTIMGFVFASRSSLATAALLTLLFWIAISRLLLKSPWGRALLAMRDDELAARGIGKRVKLLKLQAFAISGIIAATAGIIYASYVGYVDPNLASLDNSILMISMVVVGGAESLWGPLLGAAMLVSIPEVLRFVSVPDSMAGSIRLLVFGLLLVLLMHVRPQGLVCRKPG